MRSAFSFPRLGVLLAALWLSMSVLSTPAAATLVIVKDADSGEPLADAVIEIYASGTSSNSAIDDDIIQRDAAFHPHVLAVPVGSRIRFPNQDNTRHHVYSFSPAKVFDLNLYLRDTPPPVTFDQAGVVVLGCNIHDHMQAFIVVSDATHLGITGNEGSFELPALAPGDHRLRVWHPRLDDSHQQWQEFAIEDNGEQEVLLTLTATPPPAAEPSALQQRFHDATQ